MTPFTLCAATSSGNAHNNHYPNHHHITDADDLQLVARLDHVAATYTGDRRSSAGFVSSDCVVMDIDNDHTEASSDWVTPEKLAELMAGVEFMTATSRNHQKPKGALSARPRFHVYFPITEVTGADTYARLKRRLVSRFGFFDQQALDAGRFIYGTPHPETTVHDGTKLLDAWLDEADEIDVFAAFDTSTQVIGEGSRNAALSRFAGKVLIRYGQTAQARDLFDRKASLCEPPLGDYELESIWQSACRFAAKVASNPGYVSPEVYAQLTGLRRDDFTDVGQADTLAGEYANKIRYSPATKWLAYDGGAWVENDLLAQGVAQELTSRQFAEADHLVTAATDQMTATGADQVITGASSKTRGIANLDRSQLAAYQASLDAKAYRKFVLGRRLSRNITATLREAAPILQVSVRDLDTNPYLLNTPGGTWDLRDGTRRDHDPLDLITHQTAVDSLTTVRRLKEAGVEIFFEKENIWTLDAKGELLITIMSSLPQEESRSISENVRWGIKKRFADGQVFMPYPHFLGYDKGSDGRPQINPEQARLVRRIYRMFLAGYPMHRITVTLTDEGVPVPGPRGKKWYTNAIKSILTNEKYRGDALLQKTYISDFLIKKQVKNKGEVAQYYMTGSHEAIIDPETWDLVQYELAARKGKRSPYPFTMKLRCAVCGAWYGSKVWHSTDKYRSIIWQCNNKYRVEHPKPMPHLPTSQIEDAFQCALATYIRQRPAITDRIQTALDQVMDISRLEAEQAKLGITIEGLQAMMAKEIDANAHLAKPRRLPGTVRRVGGSVRAGHRPVRANRCRDQRQARPPRRHAPLPTDPHQHRHRRRRDRVQSPHLACPRLPRHHRR